MAAFETALEHGSPRIELDVQMTADGVAVVTHDTSLRRCTGCNANIYDLPMCRCSSWMPGAGSIGSSQALIFPRWKKFWRCARARLS